MTRNDAFVEAHARAYEGLPSGTVFNLWESNVDLQSDNTPELAAALGVEYDPEDESNVEEALHNAETVSPDCMRQIGALRMALVNEEKSK